ncbi:MAG: helix-turn-helix domain-containing protein, partial [Ectothiorhodospiraceae bacterium]
LGVRALQRRLAAEGTAFQDQVSLVRRELAEHYLARTSLSLDEIAARLGFDEPRSLSRLFRRWTGLTPGAWRRQMRERSGRMA